MSNSQTRLAPAGLTDFRELLHSQIFSRLSVGGFLCHSYTDSSIVYRVIFQIFKHVLYSEMFASKPSLSQMLRMLRIMSGFWVKHLLLHLLSLGNCSSFFREKFYQKVKPFEELSNNTDCTAQ